jgi:hypothetical protein
MTKKKKRNSGTPKLPSKTIVAVKTVPSLKRSYEEEIKFLHKESPFRYRIDPGFVPGMRVPAFLLVNDELEELLLEELQHASKEGGGGFLPAMKQVANVASLPVRTYACVCVRTTDTV